MIKHGFDGWKVKELLQSVLEGVDLDLNIFGPSRESIGLSAQRKRVKQLSGNRVSS